MPGASGTPEQNSCTSVSPLGRHAIANTCLPRLQSSLTYTCVCSNGQQPNSSQYSQTIPYYECTQAATNCVNNCAQGDTSCQSACRNDHPCGAQNPTRVNTTTMSTMASTASGSSATGTSESTPSNTFAGLGGGSTGTSDASQNAQVFALGFGRAYGLVLVLGSISAGFVFML